MLISPLGEYKMADSTEQQEELDVKDENPVRSDEGHRAAMAVVQGEPGTNENPASFEDADEEHETNVKDNPFSADQVDGANREVLQNVQGVPESNEDADVNGNLVNFAEGGGHEAALELAQEVPQIVVIPTSPEDSDEEHRAEQDENLASSDDEGQAAAVEEEQDEPEINEDAEGEIREDEEQRAPKTKDPDKWNQHDIQSLLVKAINHKSPVKDLEICIKCGADVNIPIKSGLYPIHYASYNDYIVCVKFLLDHGANVNSTDEIGYTPLHLAARCGNYNTMMMLIDNGAIISFNEPGKIIRNTEEKNKLGYSTAEPINLAIQNSHTECAKLLLDNGARPDNKYFMGHEICLAPLDEVECLELLLEYGADPNVFNRCGLSPLMRASKGQHIEAVRILLKHGADINLQCPALFERKTALIYAIASGNIGIINLLLGKKASINRPPDFKYAPLHCAVKKGRADIVRLLLQQGADVNEKAEEGATALMLACGTSELRDREEIVKLLICCGADINAHAPAFSYSDLYLSPLVEYLKNIRNTENLSVIEILIQNGAKVNYCEGEHGLPISKRINPFSILEYADCMVNDWRIFELTLKASTQYNPLAVHACDTLPENMRKEILAYATKPRGLKHIIRLAIQDILYPEIADKVQDLPLPPMLKDYLMYK